MCACMHMCLVAFNYNVIMYTLIIFFLVSSFCYPSTGISENLWDHNRFQDICGCYSSLIGAKG